MELRCYVRESRSDPSAIADIRYQGTPRTTSFREVKHSEESANTQDEAITKQPGYSLGPIAQETDEAEISYFWRLKKCHF